jgi:hypothetical protein
MAFRPRDAFTGVTYFVTSLHSVDERDLANVTVAAVEKTGADQSIITSVIVTDGAAK